MGSYVDSTDAVGTLDLWASHCVSTLDTAFPTERFAVVRQICLVGIGLIILARLPLIAVIKETSTCEVGTGAFGVVGNKGACALSLLLRGPERDVSVGVVAVHLSAHQDETQRRNQDLEQIFSRVAFPPLGMPLSVHDFCIVLGDLNYRVDAPSVAYVGALIRQRGIKDLVALDQLTREMRIGRCLFGFEEGEITFPPTFKFRVGSSRYNDKRVPSFCDRVLFCGPDVKCLGYWADFGNMLSDHKPVAALLALPFPVFIAAPPATNNNVSVLGPHSRRIVVASQRWRVARFNFVARHRDELSFNKGDIVEILHDLASSSSSGWAKARLGDKVGLVPLNYLERLPRTPRKTAESPDVQRASSFGDLL